jgi:predicted  nucleic acid-binding Zn-ribbon protein
MHDEESDVHLGKSHTDVKVALEDQHLNDALSRVSIADAVQARKNALTRLTKKRKDVRAALDANATPDVLAQLRLELVTTFDEFSEASKALIQTRETQQEADDDELKHRDVEDLVSGLMARLEAREPPMATSQTTFQQHEGQRDVWSSNSSSHIGSRYSRAASYKAKEIVDVFLTTHFRSRWDDEIQDFLDRSMAEIHRIESEEFKDVPADGEPCD